MTIEMLEYWITEKIGVEAFSTQKKLPQYMVGASARITGFEWRLKLAANGL